MAGDSPAAADLAATKEGKDRVVHARFRASELAAIDRAAETAGMTVSAFMRSLTLEGAGVRPFLTDEDRAVLEVLTSDMRAIGVNLNQLARTVNGARRRLDSELSGTLVDVQRLVAAMVLEMRRFAARGAQQRRGAA